MDEREKRGRESLRINRMHHPVLAVVAVHLAAVDPDGLVVLDLDGEGGRRRHVGRGGGHETREDGVVDGLAGLFEARLRDRVVLFFVISKLTGGWLTEREKFPTAAK